VSEWQDIADDIAAIEERVSDALFEQVRAQLRDDDAEAAHQREKQLAKVRRSLQKAEQLLRGSQD
jgi:hypothetical protein